ncbi:MAG: hypothetical protein CM1200mP14_19380 [Gammaproteobacteria bacterium]|nr:MAG: hypothetical protein CM1200mP14_19380 [Gammaproteobacteria bacterium]
MRYQGSSPNAKDFGTIVLKFRRNKVFLLLMVLSLGGTTRADLTTGLSPRENNSDPVPLIEAAKNQDWDKLRTLLEQGEKATVTSADGQLRSTGQVTGITLKLPSY